MDEIGHNKHSKDDGRASGEKFVIGNGQITRDVIGTKDSHF
jgi:hypothetical protein